MNGDPDSKLRISWSLELCDGSFIYDKSKEDPSDPSEWRFVQGLDIRPSSIGLVLISNEGVIEKDVFMGKGSDKFFFSKRVSYILGDNSSRQDYGIGYHDRTTNTVQISWYNEDLNPIQLESRDFEKCKSVMIPRISTASLSQS